MSEIKLLPCPFCGGKATLYEANEHRWWVVHDEPEEGMCPISDVGACVGGRMYDTKEEAAESWNRRTSAKSTLAEIEEELKEQFRKVTRNADKAIQLGMDYDTHRIVNQAKGAAFLDALEIVRKKVE